MNKHVMAAVFVGCSVISIGCSAYSVWLHRSAKLPCHVNLDSSPCAQCSGHWRYAGIERPLEWRESPQYSVWQIRKEEGAIVVGKNGRVLAVLGAGEEGWFECPRAEFGGV